MVEFSDNPDKSQSAGTIKKYTKNELKSLPFMNSELPIEERVDDLYNRLTLEERFKLMSGRGMWQLRKIKRLGIPHFGMTDGPNGVAPHSSRLKRNTYFPTSICLGASWDPELAKKFGIAIAKETRASGRHVILAPGINIHRTPMGGRTFEYLSEDPVLISELVVPLVQGIQSQRICACTKHYVANNQETRRMSSSSEVSIRALREIYLPGFKAAVTKGKTMSIMACYNRVNGLFGCENKWLLTDVLKNEWGFTGFVVSDWFATKNIKTTAACMNAGLSVEMPMSLRYKVKLLRKAFENKEFSSDILEDNVKRILRAMIFVGMFDPPEKVPQGERNSEENRRVARDMAAGGMVLLKNENNLLPIDIKKCSKLWIGGKNADRKMTKLFSGGSSGVWPPYEITPKEGIKAKIKNDNPSIEIVENPEDADYALLITGLDHKFGNDAEGKDKKQFDLPDEEVNYINEIASKNKNTIVILISGSPIGMGGWLENIPALLEAWYPGMEGGHVIADIIFGDINPSGKLPLTFPKKLSDSPAHKSERTFPGDDKVYYEEGIFVGYRHFDQNNIEPLFPFGYGLSYTTFNISDIQLNKKEFSANMESTESDEVIKITLKIANTGDRSGAEVVQIYIGDVESELPRPPKELKAFKKVFLEPGEERSLEFQIGIDSLKYYNDSINNWVIEPGTIKIYIGTSSRDIIDEQTIELK